MGWQTASTSLNEITEKLWIGWWNEINKRLYNNRLFMLRLSPFDITALGDILEEKRLLKDWVSLKQYVAERLEGELLHKFMVLFLDEDSEYSV